MEENIFNQLSESQKEALGKAIEDSLKGGIDPFNQLSESQKEALGKAIEDSLKGGIAPFNQRH